MHLKTLRNYHDNSNTVVNQDKSSRLHWC